MHFDLELSRPRHSSFIIRRAGPPIPIPIHPDSDSTSKSDPNSGLTDPFLWRQRGERYDLVSVGQTVHHVEARVFAPREEGDDFHPGRVSLSFFAVQCGAVRWW